MKQLWHRKKKLMERNSGSVGDITWTFYDSGTLVIDGSGSTQDY